MAVAIANSNVIWGYTSASSANISVSFANAVTAGNGIIVGGGTDAGNASSSANRFSSNQSDVFRWEVSSQLGGSLRVNVCAVSSATGGSGKQITFTPAPSNDFLSLGGVEVSGAAMSSFAGTTQATDNNANPSAGAISGVPAGGIVFGYCVRNAAGAITPNNGFTEIGNDSSYAGPGGASSYLLTTSSGSYTASWTVGAAAWWAAAVAYNSSDAAPSGAALRALIAGDLSGIASPGRFFKDRLQ